MFSFEVPPIPSLFAKLDVKTLIEASKSLLFEFAKVEKLLFHSTVFTSNASTASPGCLH